MEKRTISVDIMPGSSLECLKCSQYDIGRTMNVSISDGSVPFDLNGYSGTLNALKPDGTIYITPITIGDGSISFDTAEQLTPVSGDVKCEIRFAKDGIDIGTANFVLRVERSPIENGIQSETVITNINTIMRAAVKEATQTALDAAANAAASAVKSEASATVAQKSEADAKTSADQAADSAAAIHALATNNTISVDGKTYAYELFGNNGIPGMRFSEVK
jgi:hypothetical protein